MMLAPAFLLRDSSSQQPMLAHPVVGEQLASTNKIYAYVKQAGITLNVAHCLDGRAHWFIDRFPQTTYALIKLGGQVFGSDRELFPIDYRSGKVGNEAQLMGVIRMATQRDPLLPRDIVPAPIIEMTLSSLRSGRLAEVNALTGSLIESAERANEDVNNLRYEGTRNSAKERTSAWQRGAEESNARLDACIGDAFVHQPNLLAMKLDLSIKEYLPANQQQAYSMYELEFEQRHHDQQESLGTAPWLPHDRLDRMLASCDAFRAKLVHTRSSHARLINYILVLKFSRITGPYLTAVLLYDGSHGDVSVPLFGELSRLWDDATAGSGFCYRWNEVQCPWGGLIKPSDEKKRVALLFELECSALSGKYVRAKPTLAVPIFAIGECDKLIEAQS
ncbi:Uncharacterised protein [Burkholderia pseudomallei]|uniref:hypothetical protein n=1 Tax=Burkholderia glumae TaxID=337 RepID=UPI00203697E9|nr:hypothetical protein [Burkholderia glumae]MCM2542870.1 hypothetical protein [Burkholderia glumae]CAJ8786385.1 Uncharacterised protein [Burkholderia pseudomallei]